MKSLILTVLYLAKDTVHRWVTRLSSPLARVLVVFFLTLCALCFLGSYVISAKVMRDRIRSQGGDLVQMTMGDLESRQAFLPTQKALAELLDADSIALRSIGFVRNEDDRSVPAYTFEFARMGQFLPIMAASGMPTLFICERSTLSPGPSSVRLGEERINVFVRRMPEGHMLSRMFQRSDALIVRPDSYEAAVATGKGRRGSQQLLLRVRNTETAEGVRRAVDYCETYRRLEGAQGHLVSALPLLQEMDIILSNQVQCRVAFCIGIAGIVGILLTALAGMEYRQNEYIYTLMKSFGIHPLMLVGTFIAENLLLVGASFVTAVWCFMHFQRLIVQQFFKLGNYSLGIEEIMPELQLIAISLLGCVLVSSIPIIFAANRDIGRVLK